MRRLSFMLYCIIFLLPSFRARGQDPSLEDLEKVGAEMDQTDPSPPTQQQTEPQPQTEAPPVTMRIHDAPATDSSGMEPIDIRGRIKKVLEPNLFAGAPPVPGTLRNMAIGEAPEEYAVHEGDNLYDICDQLIDEPSYWPKLWAFNPGISNPHFIYPGMKLRFYAGDAENPPFLQVVTEDDIVPVDKGGMKEKDLVREDISNMLMRSEIPQNQEVIDGKDFQVAGIDDMIMVIGDRKMSDFVQLTVPAFIVEERFIVLGTVVGGSAGSYLMDKGQDVIIDPEEDLQLNTSYTVVRSTSKVRTVHGNDFVGYRYEFIAHIHIDTKDLEENVYRASVRVNRLGVQPGDLVIAYRSTKRSMPVNLPAAVKGANQQVVAFTEPLMEVGGRGEFVFLDQTEFKLQEGQVYELLQNVKVASPSFLRSSLPNSETQVAKTYILDASASGALGFILSNGLEVRLGDRTSQ